MHDTVAGGLTGLGAAAFWLVAAVVLASALAVAFSRNIIYSAFALLGAFLGVAGVYVLLASDFVAVVQLMIYVGGILVLMLFAVMLTSRISDARLSSRSMGRAAAGALGAGVLALLSYLALRTPWDLAPPAAPEPSTAAIGESLLTTYLLPFEVASVVLLAALVGALAIARGVRRERALASPGACFGTETPRPLSIKEKP